MRESVTQEFDYGCGIACYAFALGLTYRQAADRLGEEQANSVRFWVKDLTTALNKAGVLYESKHCKPYLYKRIYKEGTIDPVSERGYPEARCMRFSISLVLISSTVALQHAYV